MPLCGPLLKDAVGRLRIHIDQQVAFFNRDQVISRLSGRIRRLLQIYHCTRCQKLPAAAGIFYMADLKPLLRLHISDKTVGPAEESPFDNCMISQCPNFLPRPKKKSHIHRCGFLCWRYLFSRAVASQVLSAGTSLTTVFGMGTGGPSP